MLESIRNNKVAKIILATLRVIFIVLFVAFILMVCLQRFSGNKFSFFNLRMFTVASGSMEPKYKIGDVLISKETKPEDVKEGDVISYLGASGSFKDKVITHQVMSIEQDSNGKYMFHTQGLTNIVEDPLVYEDQLYGVVVYKVMLLSVVYKIVGTKLGLFICVVLPLLYIIGSEFLVFMIDKEEDRRSRSKKRS